MRWLKTVILAGVFAMISACAGPGVERYATQRPAFDPEGFFSGHLTAHGVVKNRGGEVIRHFNADIHAHWANGVGTLDERFVFNDGEEQTRVWTLMPEGEGRYRATAGDVVGIGQAVTAGNAMNLGYVLTIDYRGKPLNLSVDDWMYRVDDRVVINESVLSKWGIRVGSIQLTIIRQP